MQALTDHIAKDGFRLRGTAMSRVDAFSDVIFGFALTLLVVSLEVPHTFEELDHSLRGFIPFAICFVMLILIWYSHFKFFRRYGLHDLGTITINSALLFVVLFYVYPLKFLFTTLTLGIVGQETSAYGSAYQMRELMLLYGVGFTAVYWLFACLHVNAWKRRDELELNETERFLTRSSTIEYLLMGSVGVLSCIFALAVPIRYAGYAGAFYCLLGVSGTFHGRWERSRLARMAAPHAPVHRTKAHPKHR